MKYPRRTATLKELKRLLLETGDSRFAAATEALLEHFPAPRRKNLEWREFELMILWVHVQATMIAYGLSIRSACANLAKSKHKWPNGKALSEGRLGSRYAEADKFMQSDPDSRHEAESDARGLAHQMKAKRAAITKSASKPAASSFPAIIPKR